MKQIEQKIKWFNELKELDKKVIELEKLANQCNNGAENLKITLSCDKLKELKKDDILDSDGSLKTNNNNQSYTFSFGFIEYSVPTTVKKEDNISISETVDQKHFFMFLDYLLNGYNKRREFLIKKLEE